jgi:hypothetical protein
MFDIEDLITDQASVQPGRLGPRRTHGDQVINRLLVDARETNALGWVGLRHGQVDRNNPAHTGNLTAAAAARCAISVLRRPQSHVDGPLVLLVWIAVRSRGLRGR